MLLCLVLKLPFWYLCSCPFSTCSVLTSRSEQCPHTAAAGLRHTALGQLSYLRTCRYGMGPGQRKGGAASSRQRQRQRGGVPASRSRQRGPSSWRQRRDPLQETFQERQGSPTLWLDCFPTFKGSNLLGIGGTRAVYTSPTSDGKVWKIALKAEPSHHGLEQAIGQRFMCHSNQDGGDGTTHHPRLQDLGN